MLSDVLILYALFSIIVFSTSSVHSSLASECPGSPVPSIRQEASESELSLVFYYVSWCKESRLAKSVYDEVAHYYADHTYFGAVNCWHLECNCSRTFPSAMGSKKGYPHKWPTLLAHYGSQVTVQYRGEWNFVELSRFLDNLYTPVQRLNSKEELKLLNMQTVAIVLGLFPNASSNEYRKFILAAIKWLETDPEKVVRFAVSFSGVANTIVEELGAVTPLIVFINDKDIETFKPNGKWNTGKIISWLQAEVKRKHFTGPGTPSSLADQVRKGTVLAIFANEIENSNENFYSHMIDVMGPLGFKHSIQTRVKRCERFWYNFEYDYVQRQYAMQLEQELHADENNSRPYCRKKQFLSAGYAPFRYIQAYYINSFFSHFQPSIQQQADDPYSADKLLELFQYNECLKVADGQNAAELKIVISKLLTKFIEKISPHSVSHHNRTMSVQIMDANKHTDLLQVHGVSLNEETSANVATTTALIIEPQQESVYVLQKPFTYGSLLKFIKDYYADNLNFYRRSQNLASISPAAASPPTHADYVAPVHNLNELTRQLFLQSIHHHSLNTTTVLLLYTPRCAFSALMSHALLQVSVMIQGSRRDDYSNNINIVRLNTQVNDLPWEYVMHESPALIVFPRGRYAESRVFPAHFAITARNVFGFILAQLEPIEQVSVALGSCRRTLSTQQLLKCLDFVKKLAMQHIGEHLKLWQIFEEERQLIFTRLKQFKDITLDIQESFRL